MAETGRSSQFCSRVVVSVRAQEPTTGNSTVGVRGFGNQLASNGHSPYENTYRVDGINENDYSNGAPGSVIGANLGVDAIQEFNVVTHPIPPSMGVPLVLSSTQSDAIRLQQSARKRVCF